MRRATPTAWKRTSAATPMARSHLVLSAAKASQARAAWDQHPTATVIQADPGAKESSRILA